MINIGGNIAEMVVGNISMGSAYVGSQLVWEKSSPAQEYIEVEYIENTSTAYIDVGLVPTNLTRVQTQVRATALNGVLFGARKIAAVKNADCFALWFLSNQIRTDFYRTSQVPISNPSINTLYTIDKNKWKTTVNSSEKTATNGTFNSIYTMYIFNVHQPSTETRYFKGKMYYFKYYENGELLRDYVPAYQISTQKYGLLDKLSNTFYVSPNGIDFTGPSIT